MVIEITEVVTYRIDLEDFKGEDWEAEEQALEMFCQSENPWEDYGKEINERVMEIIR